MMLQCANECKFLLMMSEITSMNEGVKINLLRRLCGATYTLMEKEGGGWRR
jgi:hypothetical protein